LWRPFTRTAVSLPSIPPRNESDCRRHRRRLQHFNWHSLAQQYADALRGSDLILSFMTIAELRMGAISAGWGGRRRLLLKQFIQRFELVDADNDLCTVWARIRADARAAGRPLSPQDAWIAATALALDSPLATNNRRDFEHVQKLRLLSL
jgi:tRNA(fMet)-specific endonuclease VapC